MSRRSLNETCALGRRLDRDFEHEKWLRENDSET